MRATHHLVLRLALALCPAAAIAAAPVIQGQVTGVIDGNRLWVLPPGGQPVQVRLSGIDAPELCQPWGPDARAALNDWVAGHTASVQPVGRAEGGMVVGVLTVDGSNINQHMVEEGHAWSQRLRSGHGPYLKQERVAHALARGLHGAGGAVLPSDFRRTHGPCSP
jgi:endonuclease YncB( thermonuclease family)